MLLAATRNLILASADLRVVHNREATRWPGDHMVGKPLDFVGRPQFGMGPEQPAVKCRSREHLGIICGLE